MKIPKDYKGAYEISMEKKQKPVSALFAQEDADFVCSLCACGIAEPAQEAQEPDNIFALRHSAPLPEPVQTRNQFSDLTVTRNDPDDEDSEMLNALTQLAGAKVKQGKPPQRKKPYSRQQIAAIAADIANGKIKLPDVTLESNDEWEVLWSLVDSGSSIDAVNMEKVFPGAKIKEPRPGSRGFAAANGTTVADKGSAVIPARTLERDDITAEWKNADVAMPIMSTKKRTQGGKGGWYHETGGSIINPRAAIKSDFVESDGVYLMKILVPKSLTQKGHPPPKSKPPAQPGFAWQGAAA